MTLRLICAAGLLATLGGCATYDYAGGNEGGYYRGAPSVEYRYPAGYSEYAYPYGMAPYAYGPGYYGYYGYYSYGVPYYYYHRDSYHGGDGPPRPHPVLMPPSGGIGIPSPLRQQTVDRPPRSHPMLVPRGGGIGIRTPLR
ncbi:hypothetical protein [Xanthomonas albilineans]|uniref:Secreted protein n=1 Tax=Xanthomonas albilineans (strain GPE PC73 / CFBP 7063) TaxID=380358 RepID=D2UAR3_XANAP|nr:hypothetical protein [Xanthomonas albilineans]QHQ27090.1 hypothetical protein XaFJ1_GM000328 [Xanthomonas albilineans]CBA14889.1 hypothetical protein XALC_0348 [Xanthomonas albilineans GPE PC73]